MRKFNEQEISEILDYAVVSYVNIKSESINSAILNARADFRLQLSEVYAYPEILSELKEELKTEYRKSLIEPGSSVGIQAAQSIGEPTTQLTLNTFHFAGVSTKNVTLGVPRFDQLLNATKNPSNVSATIFYTSKPDSVYKIMKEVDNNLFKVVIGDLLIGEKINSEYKEKEWYKAYEILYGKEHLKYKWNLSLKLDVKKCYCYSVTPKMISDVINNYNDVICIHSPSNMGEVDVFIDTDDISIDDGKSGLVTEKSKELCFIVDVVMPNISKLHILGIMNITKIFPMKLQSGEWTIETEGSDLRHIMRLEGVDYKRTVSDDMWEIKRVLGIEAARTFVIKEMYKIIEHGGSYIDIRHITLLVDTMMSSGTISPVNRYGINRDVGPMAKASFEEGLDNFLRASAMTEVETTAGVSSALMIGKTGSFGTGLNSVRMDIDMIMNIDKPIRHERKRRRPCKLEIFTKNEVVKNYTINYMYVYYNKKVSLDIDDFNGIFDDMMLDYKQIIKSKLYRVQFGSNIYMEQCIKKFNNVEVNGVEMKIYNGKDFAKYYDNIMRMVKHDESSLTPVKDPVYDRFEPDSPTYDDVYEPSSPVYD